MSATAVTLTQADNKITVVSTAQVGPPGVEGPVGPPGPSGSGIPGTEVDFSVNSGVATLSVVTHWWIDVDGSVYYEDDPTNVPAGKEAWFDTSTLSVIPGLPGPQISPDDWLLEQTATQAFAAVTGASFDSHGALLSALVTLADGSTGAYAVDTVSIAFPGLVDAYHITYSVNGVTKIVTQTAVTRDSKGRVVTSPALTVAPTSIGVRTAAAGTNPWVLEQTATQAFIATSSCTYASNGALLTANVTLADGSTGVYTADTTSAAFPGLVDAYHIVYTVQGVTRTVRQTAVTRDSSGDITTAPALTIA